MPDGFNDGRYTHGHHESVLRSHRWRTAHNSAAYLLDRLAPGDSVARSNGAEPDAGRRLLAWANRAGLRDPVATASTWCFSDEEDRRWWGGLWADRLVHSTLADQALERGIAGADELAEYGAAFRDWAEQPDDWFLVPHGEILATTAE